MNVLAFFKALFADLYINKQMISKNHFYSFLGLEITDSANNKNQGPNPDEWKRP